MEVHDISHSKKHDILKNVHSVTLCEFKTEAIPQCVLQKILYELFFRSPTE